MRTPPDAPQRSYNIEITRPAAEGLRKLLEGQAVSALRLYIEGFG
jgi:Fe-S cluster assembly iron-binding protein IscA